METNVKTILKNNLLDLCWGLQAPFFSNRLPAQIPNSILFICKGNICRSPFAEHLASKLALRHGLTRMLIASAGLRVLDSHSPPEEAIFVAKAFDLDLSQHRSQSINEQMVDNFNMIVVMEPSQLKALRRTFPNAKDKSWLLSAFENKDQSANRGASRYAILDPFGKSQVEFDTCFKRIEDCIVQLFSITSRYI